MATGNKNSDIPNLDELLDLTSDDLVSVEIPSQDLAEDTAPAETPEQVEIRELRAALAAAQATKPVETPEQAEIRVLKAALEAAKSSFGHPITVTALESAPLVGDSIIIHFVSDGFLAFGQTWYRGQELEIVIGSPQHQLTFDRFGNSWLDLDSDAQIERWGEEKFRPGLWRGKKWGDISTLSDPDDIADAERAAAAEAKRRRMAPIANTTR